MERCKNGMRMVLAAALAVQAAAAQQQFGAEHVISSSALFARSVYAADVDGDGDLDVLSASAGDNTVGWYENTDGAGSFGIRQVITTATSGASSVFAADLDGDGDQDALSGSFGDDKIAWYENTDGLGTFGPQQIITTAASGPATDSLFAADLDGDGDQDVLSASQIDHEVAWYENLDGLGTFGSQQIITSAAGGASCVFAADLDGDGDHDVLSASQNDDEIAWYENLDGLGTFGPQLSITTAADGARTVFAADLDGDGDQDVLSASQDDDEVAWYENLDGLGSFGAQQVITSAADGARDVIAADVDGDGDQDVVSASGNDDEIAWYENFDGLGSFGSGQVVSTAADFPVSIFAADLDGDGDEDVISASNNDDKIAWFENLAAHVIPYGCGVNPPGSLTLISGLPSIGTTITLGVDNPLGTQPAGSLPFLAIAFQPDPAFPCGASLPGFGMGGPGASGELLIPFNPPFVFAGPPWAGAGNPTAFGLPVPNLPALVGASAYTQGLMYNATGALGVTFGLTEAVELLIGP